MGKKKKMSDGHRAGIPAGSNGPSERNGSGVRTGRSSSGKLMTVQILFYALYAVTMVLFITASLRPSALNWGFHHFAFLPLPLRAVTLAVLVAPLFPQTGAFVRNIVMKLNRFHPGNRMHHVLSAVALIGCIAVFTALYVRGNLLGDGTYLIAAFKNMNGIHGLHTFVGNAPLTGLIIYGISVIVKHLHMAAAAETAIRMVSILSGAATCAAVWFFSSLVTSGRSRRLQVMTLFFSTGAILLFFGYVELYAFPLCMLVVYSIAAYQTIRKGLPVVWASSLYGVLLTAHLGMIWLAPTIVYLWIDSIQKRRIPSVVAAIIATAVITLGVTVLCGYPPAYLLTVFFTNDSSGNLLSLNALPPHWHAYTLFSGWHLLDLVNLLAMVSPFMLLLFGTALWYSGAAAVRSDSASRYSVLLAFCSLAFVTLTNLRIGMSRDWDVCALFLTATVIGMLYVWFRAPVPAPLRRRMVVAAVVLTGIHTLSMAAVNAGERSYVARYTMLPDARVWSREAMAYAWEDLSTYYRTRMDGGTTIKYIEKSLACDSTNARRWMLLTEYYLWAGALRKADRSLMNATLNSVGQTRPLIEKAIAFQNRNAVDSALHYYRKALDTEAQATVAYQIGTLLATRKANYRLALEYFDFAVKADSTFALAYRNRGLCHMSLHEWSAMKDDFEHYFTLSPQCPQNRELKNIIRTRQVPGGSDAGGAPVDKMTPR